MKLLSQLQVNGVNAALASAFFLGMTPVFGKLAIRNGLPPLSVVALRTILAAVLLYTVVYLHNRSFFYIYPAGLLGCLLAGSINGVGSLLYYAALGRINASLGQIIYSFYPLFLAFWLLMDRQVPSRLTIFRLCLVLPALYLLVGQQQQIDKLGVIMMMMSAALYALHLPINQRVLFDMPAPTVTLYTLAAMSAVVVPGFFISALSHPVPPLNLIPGNAWLAVGGLTLVTFFARLTLFLGVKHLGGMQTALLGLVELLITIAFSHLILNEHLTTIQWLGVSLLAISLALSRFEKQPQRKAGSGGWLGWISSPAIPKDLPWQPHN